jgi:hypothetical protein
VGLKEVDVAMNYRVALDLLGLDGDEPLTSERVRRGYMHKLPLYPPERDPAGFRRLCEAYELVRQLAADDAAGNSAGAEQAADSPAAVSQVGFEAEPPLPPVAAEPPATVERTADKPFVPQILPVARAVRMPSPPPLAGLLELLEAGDIDAAQKVEREWRSSSDADDVRQSNARLAARWTLVRELLGVARELPGEVVRILARAISHGDLATARPALEAFRHAQPRAAELANTALRTQAPTIFAPIEHTLWVPSPSTASAERPPYQAPYRGSSSGSSGGIPPRVLWAIPVALIATVRVCASSSSTPSLPHYSIPESSVTHEQIEALLRRTRQIDPPVSNEWSLPPPPPPMTAQSAAEASDELLQLTVVMADDQLSSDGQRQAVGELASQAADWQGKTARVRRCADLRASLDALRAAEQSPITIRGLRADEYIAAIGARIAVMCPAKSAPEKPTKPAPGKATKRPRPAAEKPAATRLSPVPARSPVESAAPEAAPRAPAPAEAPP